MKRRTSRSISMKKLALAIFGTATLAFSGGAIAQTVDPKFVEQLRQALIQNPEIVSTAMKAAQAREQAAQQQTLNNQVAAMRPTLIAATSPGVVLGNPAGTQTLVEFLDYRCGYCQKMHNVVNEVIAENPNTRVLIYMRPVLGPDSEILARYALAADIQGKFKAVHDELYTVQYKTDEAALVVLSKKTGINWTKAKTDMNGPIVNDRLAKNISMAEQMQINGTPFFVTPSTVVPGATDKANLIR